MLAGRMLCPDPSLLAMHMHVVSLQACRKVGNRHGNPARRQNCGLANVQIITGRQLNFVCQNVSFRHRKGKQSEHLCVLKPPEIPQAVGRWGFVGRVGGCLVGVHMYKYRVVRRLAVGVSDPRAVGPRAMSLW